MCTRRWQAVAWIFLASGLSGCQSWPAANYPLQNTTRVPPPGTGTYALPNGYYNNTSGISPANGTMQASLTNSSVGPAPMQTGTYPAATNTPAGTFSPAQLQFTDASPSGGESIQSWDSAAGQSGAEVVSAAYASRPATADRSRELDASGTAPDPVLDSPSPYTVDAPSLRWQQN